MKNKDTTLLLTGNNICKIYLFSVKQINYFRNKLFYIGTHTVRVIKSMIIKIRIRCTMISTTILSLTYRTLLNAIYISV